jgi:predicted nucleic acid-binding protein
MTILIDTSVLVSAALRDRIPERVVLFVATNAEYRWMVTPDILNEYASVLARPKFGLSAEALQHWSELIACGQFLFPNLLWTSIFPAIPKMRHFWLARLLLQSISSQATKTSWKPSYRYRRGL